MSKFSNKFISESSLVKVLNLSKLKDTFWEPLKKDVSGVNDKVSLC